MSVSARNWAWRQRWKWDAVALDPQTAKPGTWVPLNHGDKLVLLCLAEHTSLTERVAYPGIARIADWCSMGQRTVNGHLRALEAGGLIRRYKRERWDGKFQRNEYELLVPDDEWQEDERYMEENGVSF